MDGTAVTALATTYAYDECALDPPYEIEDYAYELRTPLGPFHRPPHRLRRLHLRSHPRIRESHLRDGALDRAARLELLYAINGADGDKAALIAALLIAALDNEEVQP